MYWVVFDWIYFPILLTLCSDQFCFSFYSIQMSFCQKNCGPFRAQLGILLIYLKGGIRTPKINSKTHNLVVLSALRVAPVWYLPLVQFIYCKYIMTIRNSMSAGRFWVSPSVVFRSILDLRASRDPEYTKWPEWSHWVFFFFLFVFLFAFLSSLSTSFVKENTAALFCKENVLWTTENIPRQREAEQTTTELTFLGELLMAPCYMTMDHSVLYYLIYQSLFFTVMALLRQQYPNPNRKKFLLTLLQGGGSILPENTSSG